MCAAALAASTSAAADDPEDQPKPRWVVAPSARQGGAIVYAARPNSAARACSFRTPICVHSTRDRAGGAAALAVLVSADRAWATLTGALGLPAPDLDPASLAYDVYLVDHADLPETRLAARDVRSKIDRARAFTVLDSEARAGCALDVAVARALARASIYRLAPAMDEGTARAQSEYLAQLTTPCGIAFAADGAYAFQSQADRAAASAHVGDPAPIAAATSMTRANALFAEGASLFWSRIDWAYGRSPGGIVGATWTLAPTQTAVGARTWRNEPDAFDVLRISFKNALSTGSTIADLMLDVAIARAFMGSAAANDATEAHQPETRTLGEAGGVPLEWDIPWPAKARRFASRAHPEPTGASYLRVRTEGAPAGARLRAEIAWEEHALFRWAFVKVDAKGHEIGRVVIPTRERATEAQMTLVDLGDAASVLLVGVNTGDPAYSFDPDDAVWEPHGWLVTVAAE
jgi:hypothetical protein